MAHAFFDPDGTLTKFDTFIPYCLLAFLYRPWRVFAVKPLFRACMNSYKGNMYRQEFKEGFINAFLGIAEKDAAAPTEHRRTLRRSASPDIYLEPIAKHWKLAGVIWTTLEWRDGCLTGRILGKK